MRRKYPASEFLELLKEACGSVFSVERQILRRENETGAVKSPCWICITDEPKVRAYLGPWRLL